MNASGWASGLTRDVVAIDATGVVVVVDVE